MKRLLGIWYRPEFTLRQRITRSMVFAALWVLGRSLIFGLDYTSWWERGIGYFMYWAETAVSITLLQEIFRWISGNSASAQGLGPHAGRTEGEGVFATTSGQANQDRVLIARRPYEIMLWGALLATIPLYALVAAIAEPSEITVTPSVVWALLVTAIGLVSVSFPLKNWLRNAYKGSREPHLAYMAGTVCCEAAALLGIAVAYLSDSRLWIWFLLIGAAGLVLHYPKREGSRGRT